LPIRIAFNGGYWNQDEHPVGICAGSGGIYGTLAHPAGIAFAGGRVVFGPMSSHITLSISTKEGETALSPRDRDGWMINPRPLPSQSACLIEPANYPWPLDQANGEFQIIELEEGGPLAFNSARGCRIVGAAAKDDLKPDKKWYGRRLLIYMPGGFER